MWPGTSDTLLKAFFFAGLWLIALHGLIVALLILVVVADKAGEAVGAICGGLAIILIPTSIVFVLIKAPTIHRSIRVTFAMVVLLILEMFAIIASITVFD